MFFNRLQDTKKNLGVYMGLEVLLPKSIISREIHTLCIKYHKNQSKPTKINDFRVREVQRTLKKTNKKHKKTQPPNSNEKNMKNQSKTQPK